MPKVVPFPVQRVHQTAVLLLRASRETYSPKPAPWRDRPVPPEALGNLLQRLVVLQPGVVLLIENVVAEVLALIET